MPRHRHAEADSPRIRENGGKAAAGGADLEPARQRLKLFLIQYFSGPTTYSEERGHPRLRIRHVPFGIGQLSMAVIVYRSTGENDGEG